MSVFDPYIMRIEKELKEVLPPSVDGAWLSRMAGTFCPEAAPEQADSFLEPGRDLLRRGGKRWRPLLSLLVCESLGGGRAADSLVPLVEIPHNGSLIIDDIEDSSPMRRGLPAAHTVHGEDLALNMGNLMYFLPTTVLEQSGLDEDVRLALTWDWMMAMRRLHLGQGYDIAWHRDTRFLPNESAYMRMCRFKTGSMASLAASIGGRAAGKGETRNSLLPKLCEACEILGVGFQILDDVRNLTTGNPGKDRGDDIIEGKKSLPVILHAAREPESIPRLWDFFTGASEADGRCVEEAIALLTESGAVKAAEEKGLALLESSRQEIVKALPGNEECRLLSELISVLGARIGSGTG